MPNWVDNAVTITGPNEELARFMELIGNRPKFASEDQTDFSFHSFITLPDEVDPEVYHGPSGWKNGEKVGDSEYNWYTWNNNNWLTKWDACDQDVTASLGENGEINQIYITFQTAWAPPEPVFEEMGKQFPTLDIRVWWEEEQGFGAEFTMHNNNVTLVESWDIPNSHEDYVKRDNADGCVCSWAEDKTDWYDDCPGKEKVVFTVEVVTKVYVEARNEEHAIEAAKAEESGYDIPNGATIRKALYSDEYRVVDRVVEEEEE